MHSIDQACRRRKNLLSVGSHITRRESAIDFEVAPLEKNQSGCAKKAADDCNTHSDVAAIIACHCTMVKI
jgi:hypothetical protein